MDKFTADEQSDASIEEDFNSKSLETFRAYHPFSTYSDPSNSFFVTSDGKKSGLQNEDIMELFHIGRDAFNLLPKTESREGFNIGYFDCYEGIDQWRYWLRNELIKNELRSNFRHDERAEPEFNKNGIAWIKAEISADNLLMGFSDGQLLSMHWGEFPDSQEEVFITGKNGFREACLRHALSEIDKAIFAMNSSENGAIAASIAATNALSNAILSYSGGNKLQTVLREIKKNKAKEFQPVREKANRIKRELAQKKHGEIARMNADLLAKPRNEGWKLEVRAKHIADRTGLKPGYIKKLIATKRKTKQT